MITTLMTLAALVLPVSDQTGKPIPECSVRADDTGGLTLVCAGQDPLVLDYRMKEGEKAPEFRIERVEDGRVVKVEILPRREINWRPVAWVALTVGAVFGSHWIQTAPWEHGLGGEDGDDGEGSASPSRPRR